MADAGYKTSAGLSYVKRKSANGEITTFPLLISWDNVLCSGETDATGTRYHTLAVELPQLIEYMKQGVKVDEGDTPENYLKNSV